MKIGVIGCGKIAERHLSAYRKLEDVKVIISDLDISKAQRMGREHDVEWTESADELLKMKGVVAIDVCVPTMFHREIILKALEHDKHVFCEKPLVISLKDAKEIKRKASQTKKIVMSGYLYRFHPAFRLVKEVLEERIIGRPYYAIFRVGGRGSHRIWKHLKSQGGGAINEMAVHMLNLVIWYFGDVKSVENLYADILLKKRKVEDKEIRPDAEDFVLLKLYTEQGVTTICESDLITPSYMNYIEIQGTNGSIWTSILEYFPTVVYCKESRGVYNQGNNFFRFPKVDLFEREIKYFVESMRDGEKSTLNSIEDSIKVLKIIEKIRNKKITSNT